MATAKKMYWGTNGEHPYYNPLNQLLQGGYRWVLYW